MCEPWDLRPGYYCSGLPSPGGAGGLHRPPPAPPPGPGAAGGAEPAPSQPVPPAVQPRRRRQRGRQVCPARRHRARRPPGAAPAAAAERGRRPPPRLPSLARAAAKPPFSPAPRRRSGRRTRGLPRWWASPSPGAALVEREIAGRAAGTVFRRAPAAVGRASWAPGGTEKCRFAPWPRRRRGGGARASGRSSEHRLCPQPPGAGRACSAGAARRSPRSFTRSPTRSIIPGRVREPRPPRRSSQRRLGAGSLRPRGPARSLPGAAGRSALL